MNANKSLVNLSEAKEKAIKTVLTASDKQCAAVLAKLQSINKIERKEEP